MKEKKNCDELYDFENELECACDSKMGLALKIGIGVAAIAVVGSIVTCAILKKHKKEN